MGDLGAIRGYFVKKGSSNISLKTLFGEISGGLLVLGYVCAVTMVFYIAIRYFVAKPAEKAHLKTQLIYLFAGALLLSTGTTILGVLSGAFQSVFK